MAQKLGSIPEVPHHWAWFHFCLYSNYLKDWLTATASGSSQQPESLSSVGFANQLAKLPAVCGIRPGPPVQSNSCSIKISASLILRKGKPSRKHDNDKKLRWNICGKHHSTAKHIHKPVKAEFPSCILTFPVCPKTRVDQNTPHKATQGKRHSPPQCNVLRHALSCQLQAMQTVHLRGPLGDAAGLQEGILVDVSRAKQIEADEKFS